MSGSRRRDKVRRRARFAFQANRLDGAMSSHRTTRFSLPSLSFWLLAALLTVLLFTGGASRSDTSGQVFVRIASMLVLILAVLFGDRLQPGSARPLFYMVGLAILLPLLQLVPLPPSWWQMLPGRAIFARPEIGGNVWRPLAVIPGAALNAAASLVVPLAVLVAGAGLREGERLWTLTLLLILVTLAMLVGLAQLSAGGFDYPFVNDTVGLISGPFANRNHFALLLTLGMLVSPIWIWLGQDGTRRSGRGRGRGVAAWRVPIAVGLVIVLLLLILATGSRAGTLLGVLGLLIGLLLARQGLLRAVRRLPGWAPWAIGAGIAALVLVFVSISVAAGRAVSIDRAFALDAAQDMRARALPTVLAMVRDYFPVGSGFGSFEPLFRLHEPFALLKPTYFNHAHNDFLEIVLEGGVPALLLLGTGLVWWVLASVRAWRRNGTPAVVLGRAGSAMLLLILIASIFDYPARTPMVMALIMLAALWLCWATDLGPSSPLRNEADHL